MPGTGAQSQVLTAVQTQVNSLGLTIDGNIVTIEFRKKFSPTESPGSYVISIVAPGMEKQERLWGDTWWYTAKVLVGFQGAGRLEFAADLTTEYGQVLDWREALVNLLKEPANLGLNFVAETPEIEYDPVLDESLMEKGVDASVVSFGFRCLLDGPLAG